MSSRAIRKLQKQQESELQQQQRNEHQSTSEESEEPEPSRPKAKNAFDLLNEVDEPQSDQDEEDSEHKEQSEVATPSKPKAKSRKKKKKQPKQPNDGDGVSTPGKSQAKDKDKGKGRSSTSQLDEIDLALKALSSKERNGSYAFSAPRHDSEHEQFCRVIAAESRHLNALNEMKKLFGDVVLESQEDENAAVVQARRRRGRGGQIQLDLGSALSGRYSPASKGQGLAGLALRRNVFMAGKEAWPRTSSGGLGMEFLPNESPSSRERYKFIHNRQYQDTQREFQMCVASMQPESLIQLLQLHPYHVATLLQVSDIAKQQGDHSVSGDLLERALFSFGRSVPSSFGGDLFAGRARLSFLIPENRELWLAVWRYIANLTQRGTFRTAYEWAKLLFSLEPDHDPYCMLLILDHLALKGGQAEQLLNLVNSRTNASAPTILNSRSTLQISVALAEHKLKRPQEAKETLAKAIKTLPWVFARLFKELDIEHVPKSIWGKKARNERENFDCELYVHGAKDLWNTPETKSFLTEVAAQVPDHSEPPENFKLGITLNEARHVLLSGVPSLIGLIPRSFTTMSMSSSDPLPPEDTQSSYLEDPPQHSEPIYTPRATRANEDDDTENTLDEAQEYQSLRSFFSSIMPWIGGGDGRSEAEDQQALETDINRAATESGVPREVIEENGSRLLHLLGRIVGRQAGQEHHIEPGAETQQQNAEPSSDEGDLAQADDNSEVVLARQEDEDLSRAIQASIQENQAQETQRQAHEAETSREHEAAGGEEPYDEDRNKRWLAGQGLLRLKDFTHKYGTVQELWMGEMGQEIVTEYARRLLQLREPRTRAFITDYVLQQGTSTEVKHLVLRFVDVERAR